MQDYIIHITEEFGQNSIVLTFLGIVGLFLEMIAFFLAYEIVEVFFRILFSLPQWIRNVTVLIKYILANQSRRALSFKLIFSVGVIIAITCFTFKSKNIDIPCWQSSLLIFFCSIYGVVLYKKLKKLDQELKEQYIKQRRRFNYFGTSTSIDSASYMYFLIGILVDEKKFVYWFTNILFGICAPVSILAYIYYIFCDYENLVYIVSLVSIAIALYSVWKTVDSNRATTDLIKKMATYSQKESGNVEEYQFQEPDNSSPENWINLLNNK